MTITYNLIKVLSRNEVLEVIRVGNLARLPYTFIGRIINHGGIPLALVDWVGFHGSVHAYIKMWLEQKKGGTLPSPFTTSRRFVAFGVSDNGSDPFAVFLIVPFFRFLSICKKE